MKLLFSYTLLIIFAYSIIGYYPVFLLSQSEVKNEMDQRIRNVVPPDEVSVLIFNEADYLGLIWNNNKEFRYNGNMYDVVKVSKKENGNVHIYCINDKKETELLTELEKQTQNNSSRSTSENQRQNQFSPFSNFYLPAGTNTDFVPEESTILAPDFQSSFISFIEDIPSPPPKPELV